MKMYYETLFLILPFVILVAGCAGPGSDHSYPDIKVNIANLKETVRFLTHMQPQRNHKNIPAMNTAADFIRQKMKGYGLKTKEQKFEVDGKTYINVIGTLGDARKPRIIIGAHYDVCDDQPGADDNASAVAGLLEIARVMKKHEQALPYRMDFVAYALEEPPYFGTENMGSYIHAKSLFDAKVDVKCMICLEMIGYFSDKDDSQEYPYDIMKLLYPDKGNFIAVVGNFDSSGLVSHMKTHIRSAPIEVESLSSPSFVQGVNFSDHRNYWEFGYKAVMITDTSFYRNPNYHEKTDTMDTLDFDKMAAVVKGVSRALLRL
jgi:Zn-dependent M28 family amino/carboxypeptidase